MPLQQHGLCSFLYYKSKYFLLSCTSLRKNFSINSAAGPVPRCFKVEKKRVLAAAWLLDCSKTTQRLLFALTSPLAARNRGRHHRSHIKELLLPSPAVSRTSARFPSLQPAFRTEPPLLTATPLPTRHLTESNTEIPRIAKYHPRHRPCSHDRRRSPATRTSRPPQRQRRRRAAARCGPNRAPRGAGRPRGRAGARAPPASSSGAGARAWRCACRGWSRPAWPPARGAPLPGVVPAPAGAAERRRLLRRVLLLLRVGLVHVRAHPGQHRQQLAQPGALARRRAAGRPAPWPGTARAAATARRGCRGRGTTRSVTWRRSTAPGWPPPNGVKPASSSYRTVASA